MLINYYHFKLDFVKSQKKILDREGQKELMTPRERVYQVQNYTTTSRISLDVFDVSVSPHFSVFVPNPHQNVGIKLLVS
jgi:hypothetical protein